MATMTLQKEKNVPLRKQPIHNNPDAEPVNTDRQKRFKERKASITIEVGLDQFLLDAANRGWQNVIVHGGNGKDYTVRELEKDHRGPKVTSVHTDKYGDLVIKTRCKLLEPFTSLKAGGGDKYIGIKPKKLRIKIAKAIHDLLVKYGGRFGKWLYHKPSIISPSKNFTGSAALGVLKAQYPTDDISAIKALENKVAALGAELKTVDVEVLQEAVPKEFILNLRAPERHQGESCKNYFMRVVGDVAKFGIDENHVKKAFAADLGIHDGSTRRLVIAIYDIKGVIPPHIAITVAPVKKKKRKGTSRI
ncbi:hypothetical protein C4569_01665 [Candidatus Parcubacteria bacterium]|nr:MAG: hypothetical protein C4569_01665 [Candidatus Parcubacteria bacterium]